MHPKIIFLEYCVVPKNKKGISAFLGHDDTNNLLRGI